MDILRMRMVKKEKVHFLKNAINLNEFSYSEESRKERRDEFGLTDELVIGHIGRFAEQKNHRFLIDVFENVQKCMPNVKLLLVGEGELRKDIEEYVKAKGIQEKVIFAGIRKDVSKLLSAMDVFALPSLYEGMPNVIIEAQASGLPCFIADTITREADLTGLVKYLSLEDAALWSSEIGTSIKKENVRAGQLQVMTEKGYDIHEEVQKFTMLMTN